MKILKSYRLLILIVFAHFHLTSSEVVTASIAAGVSAVVASTLAGFEFVKCRFYECCTDRWINSNFTELTQTMNKKLYGQHLVIGPVVRHLKGHVKDNPSKALALSFHGWTGTGKNYVSKMIAESIYRKGMKSKFVKLISATKEFPHEEAVSLYKDKLRDIIESNVRQCQQSLFIFDEMDKMPPGLIDTIKPYLDYYEHLDGVDYRKAVFVFLSNTAGNDISEATLSQWVDGGNREDIKLKDMEQVIIKPAVNTKSGLWHSELITKHLITAYIPFLPLERRHVKQCVRDGLISKGYYKPKDEIPDIKISEIAEELTYYPDNVNLFSTTGCKRVLEKIDFVMEEF